MLRLTERWIYAHGTAAARTQHLGVCSVCAPGWQVELRRPHSVVDLDTNAPLDSRVITCKGKMWCCSWRRAPGNIHSVFILTLASAKSATCHALHKVSSPALRSFNTGALLQAPQQHRHRSTQGYLSTSVQVGKSAL